MTMQLPHFLRHTGDAFGCDEADGEPSEPREVFGAMPGADAAPILIDVPVEDRVTTILDAPIAPIGCEDLLRRGIC